MIGNAKYTKNSCNISGVLLTKDTYNFTIWDSTGTFLILITANTSPNIIANKRESRVINNVIGSLSSICTNKSGQVVVPICLLLISGL